MPKKKNILKGVNVETQVAAETLSGVLDHDLTRVQLEGNLSKMIPEVREDMKRARKVKRDLDRDLNRAYNTAFKLLSRIETKYTKAIDIQADAEWDEERKDS